MKTRFSLHLTFAAILSMALPTFAQIEGPPTAIDYQGRVLDAVGDPVAQGTTANIEMYFRIWNDISGELGANLVWAEKQIVTVADGNFSVRLGEGDPIEVSAGDNVIVPAMDDPRGPLLQAFDGKDRFLGVSVAPNSVTKPMAEIRPRLAFLTAPFSAVAEKARFAEFGPASGIFSADQIGVGVTLPGSLLEVDGLNELSPTSGSGLISSGPIGGSHIAFDADDIQGYSNGSTPGSLNLNTHGGMTNIGSAGQLTRVSGLFETFGGQGGSFKVFDNPAASGKQIVAGVQGFFAGGQFRFEGAGTPIDIGQDASGSFVVDRAGFNRFTVTAGGSVGIATTSPSDTLTIGNAGSIRLNGGDLRFLVATGQHDGLRWVSSNGATTYARMYRNSSNGYIYMFNSGGGFGSGPYLPPGNTDWVAASDERLKSDIEPLTGILDKIENIRIAGYNMAGMQTDPATGGRITTGNRPPRQMRSGKTIKHEIGTIAQDWLEHFPELVTEPLDGHDHYGLSYDRVGVVAIGAAQELNAKFKVQEAQLKARDQKIAELESRLAKIEALMSAAK